MTQEYSIFPSCPHSSRNCPLIVLHVLHKKPTPGQSATGANWEENATWLSGFERGFEHRVLGKASWSWSLVDVRAPLGKWRRFAVERKAEEAQGRRGQRDEGGTACCVAGGSPGPTGSSLHYSSAEDEAGLS